MSRTIDILNGIPHPVALLDARSRITAMNSSLEALTGYALADVRGVAAEYVIRASVGGRMFLSPLAGGQPFSCEGDVIDANRKKIPIRFTASLLKDAHARPDGIMVVLENISLLRELNSKVHHGGQKRSMIGHCPGMQELFELLPVLAHTDATVLITGETGTGKDVLAEAIHHASKRAPHPFVKVNCGAIPEALLESELFGHKRGAFTGAHGDKPGMFRLAQGGTIFLTEIGDLPLQLQVKLLTVLDDREFYPLGSSRKESVNVRIITGTHRHLKQLVKEGKFREDLFFRLNVLRAHLPPLRERGDDIRLLLDHFLQRISSAIPKEINGFTRAAYSRLEAYHYPGNVRELRNIVEYAANICGDKRIDVRHLPPSVLGPDREEIPKDTASAAVGRGGPISLNSRANGFQETSAASWTDIEKKKILAALLQNNGNRTRAARELGWGRSTLWRKIKLYGIG